MPYRGNSLLEFIGLRHLFQCCLNQTLLSGYDNYNDIFTTVLFSNKATLLVCKPLGESKFWRWKSQKKKNKHRSVAHRLILLLDLVAVDRCRMEFEDGRIKVNFALHLWENSWPPEIIGCPQSAKRHTVHMLLARNINLRNCKSGTWCVHPIRAETKIISQKRVWIPERHLSPACISRGRCVGLFLVWSFW